MRAPVVDSMLKKLEIAADEQGFPIDDNEDYKAVCKIVTDYVYDGIKPTTNKKLFVAQTLQNLYRGLGLDYYKTLDELIEKEWNK